MQIELVFFMCAFRVKQTLLGRAYGFVRASLCRDAEPSLENASCSFVGRDVAVATQQVIAAVLRNDWLLDCGKLMKH